MPAGRMCVSGGLVDGPAEDLRQLAALDPVGEGLAHVRLAQGAAVVRRDHVEYQVRVRAVGGGQVHVVAARLDLVEQVRGVGGRRQRVEAHPQRRRVGGHLLVDRGLVAGLVHVDRVHVRLAQRVGAGLPLRVARELELLLRRVRRDLVGTVGVHVVVHGRGAGQGVLRLDRHRAERRHRHRADQPRRGLGQLERDAVARGRDPGHVVALDVLLHRGGVGRPPRPGSRRRTRSGP